MPLQDLWRVETLEFRADVITEATPSRMIGSAVKVMWECMVDENGRRTPSLTIGGSGGFVGAVDRADCRFEVSDVRELHALAHLLYLLADSLSDDLRSARPERRTDGPRGDSSASGDDERPRLPTDEELETGVVHTRPRRARKRAGGAA